MLPQAGFALSTIGRVIQAFAGKLWPDHPTLNNFAIVLGKKHYSLSHFWLQLRIPL
jgi:multiple sugar transport system permease protein